MKFFVRMLQEFFERMNPASTMPKPACMKKTKNAPISTHTVSMPLMAAVGPAMSAARAGVATARRSRTGSASPNERVERLTFIASPFRVAAAGTSPAFRPYDLHTACQNIGAFVSACYKKGYSDFTRVKGLDRLTFM